MNGMESNIEYCFNCVLNQWCELETGLYTAACLEKLEKISLDNTPIRHTVTNPPVSMLSFTDFPTEAPSRSERFNHTAKAVSGRQPVSSNSNTFLHINCIVSYSQPAGWIIPFHYTHHFTAFSNFFVMAISSSYPIEPFLYSGNAASLVILSFRRASRNWGLVPSTSCKDYAFLLNDEKSHRSWSIFVFSLSKLSFLRRFSLASSSTHFSNCNLILCTWIKSNFFIFEEHLATNYNEYSIHVNPSCLG